MELIKYTLCDIELMMVDIEGTLYCSTPQLEKVFRCSSPHLRHIANKHRKEEFSVTRGQDLLPKMMASKVTNDHLSDVEKNLEISRLQKNTRLWSEDDVLGFAFALRSDIARQCRVQFKEILKQHARRETVSRDMYEQLMRQHAEVINQIPVLQEAIEELRENQRAMASHAGASLRLVRETK